MDKKIQVWDREIRLFHWLLVICIAGAYLTRARENLLLFHVAFGTSAVGVLFFRLVWGFTGGGFSRFSTFIPKPSEFFGYLKQLSQKRPHRHLTHNPAAALAMIGMLLLFGLLTVTGLLTLWGQEKIGLMAAYIPLKLGVEVAEAHEVLAMLGLVLIGLHLVGMSVDSWMHKELIMPAMIHGQKRVDEEVESQLTPQTLVQGRFAFPAALGSVLICSLLFAVQFSGAPKGVAIKSEQLIAQEKLYRKECGSCHFEFHPSLLPQKAWTAMMEDLSDHFGDDATLKGPVAQQILEYLVANASEKADTEASLKITRARFEGNEIQRISKSRYWIHRHDEIDPKVFQRKSIRSKLNCVACHKGARDGLYEDAEIHIPDEKTKAY